MLNIYCGGVEIDFRGHTLGAKHGASGVTLFVGQNLHFRKSYPNKYGPASEDNRNVVLRNGVIDFTGGELTGLGVEFIDSWGSPSEFSGGNRPCIDRRHCQPKPISYVDNNYKLERLTVLTNDIAIAVEGSHTIIRDCIIESAGNAAIFIAGPNVTIENCEIRLKTPPASEVPDGEPKPRAAIVLRDASNAVIRNNRIRVDKGLQNTHCILIHDDAQGVSIENNTFINVDGDPVTKSEGSDVTMVDNKNEHRWWPR